MIENTEKYLSAGNQTAVPKDNDLVPNVHADINGVFELIEFVRKNLKPDETKKDELFRKRTAEEVLKSGFATGCTDYALALLPLLRKNGIPACYIEAVRNRWLEKGDINHLDGHVFVEIFLDNEWYIINPQEGAVSKNYTRHKVIARGLDSWDMKIKDLESLKKKFVEFRNKTSGIKKQ